MWEYSLEKAYRYSADLVELDLEDRRIRMNDLERTLRTVPIAELGKENTKRFKDWIKHMESLDPKEMKKKEEEKKKDPLKSLRGVVPFIG